MDERRVTWIRAYGRVELCLRERMEERGLTRNHLARLVNTRY